MTVKTQAKSGAVQSTKPNKALQALERTFERLRGAATERPVKFDPLLGSDQFRER